MSRLIFNYNYQNMLIKFQIPQQKKKCKYESNKNNNIVHYEGYLYTRKRRASMGVILDTA
jgi:hypothetical protein